MCIDPCCRNAYGSRGSLTFNSTCTSKIWGRQRQGSLFRSTPASSQVPRSAKNWVLLDDILVLGSLIVQYRADPQGLQMRIHMHLVAKLLFSHHTDLKTPVTETGTLLTDYWPRTNYIIVFSPVRQLQSASATTKP